MGTHPHDALHRTILAVDVSAFGGRGRNGQEEIRRGLYSALDGAFDECGLDWSAVHHEDRGDGVLALIPPSVPKRRVVGALPRALAGELRRYNATRNEDARIKLRIAVTAGEVRHDEHGVVGDDVNLAFRLLDARPLREAVARTTGVFALIVSRRFFEDVIRCDPATEPEAYRRIDVAVKEVRDEAWVYVPDGGHVFGRHLPAPRPPARHRKKRGRPPWTLLALVAFLAAGGLVDVFAAEAVTVPPCPAPVQLNVLTSAEKEAVITSRAVEFERASREFTPHECKGVSVLVTRGSSAKAAAAALAGGWAGHQDFVDQGAEPHVWLPDASFEADAVTATLSRDSDVPVRLHRRDSIVRSPVVLGASPELAARIEQADREFHWRDVGPVAAVDTSSGAGLAAAVALVHKTLEGLTLERPDAARLLHQAALATTTSTPCEGDVALVASEKTVIEDEDCVVLYPQGASVVLDHPFVEVEWTDRPANQRRRHIVERFREYLRSIPSQQAFGRAGFHDLNGGPGPKSNPRRGRRGDPVVVSDAQAVREAWDAAARSRVVALASDGSDGAARFAAELRRLFGPRDEVVEVPLTADVLKEAVRREADVVVLLATGAVTAVDPDAGGPVRTVGVGFADDACADSSALFQATDARGGTCYETASPKGPQRALDGVATAIWGRTT